MRCAIIHLCTLSNKTISCNTLVSLIAHWEAHQACWLQFSGDPMQQPWLYFTPLHLSRLSNYYRFVCYSIDRTVFSSSVFALSNPVQVHVFSGGDRGYIIIPMLRGLTALLSWLHLHCIALHCIALHCIALHCIALHCIAIYKTE